MSSCLQTTTRGLASALALALLAGCGGAGGIEGRYFNTQSGDFAFELKNGKVYSFTGEEDPSLEYEVRGDKVVVRPRGESLMGEMVFTRQGGGELSLAGMMTLKKE